MLVNIKKNYFILIFTILFLYFFFNLLDGERGLISYFEKKNHLKELDKEKTQLSEELKFANQELDTYQNEIRNLKTDAIDIEERVRKQFKQEQDYAEEEMIDEHKKELESIQHKLRSKEQKIADLEVRLGEEIALLDQEKALL